MAEISSGGPLSPEVLLAATLRFLAGGNYIDIVDHIHIFGELFRQSTWQLITLNYLPQRKNGNI
jgi:hypothetical protein